MRDQILKVLIPLASWGLNLAVPVIPAFVWSGLLTAIINGDITLEHISVFLAAHGVKTFPEYVETEGQRQAAELPSGKTNTNMTVGQLPVDDRFPKQVNS